MRLGLGRLPRVAGGEASSGRRVGVYGGASCRRALCQPRGSPASPELLETLLVALEELPQDELGGVRLVPLEQLLEMGVGGQRHVSGQAVLKRLTLGRGSGQGERGWGGRPRFYSSEARPPARGSAPPAASCPSAG